MTRYSFVVRRRLRSAFRLCTNRTLSRFAFYQIDSRQFLYPESSNKSLRLKQLFKVNTGRRSRVVVSIFMLFSMLVTHVSFAACRYLHTETTSASERAFAPATVPDSHFSGCKEIHQKNRDLCAKYTAVAKTTVDTPKLPQVLPFVANTLGFALLPTQIPASATLVPAALIPIQAAAPPLCIRHCSFQL